MIMGRLPDQSCGIACAEGILFEGHIVDTLPSCWNNQWGGGKSRQLFFFASTIFFRKANSFFSLLLLFMTVSAKKQ
jgi:hypothetical protein